MWNSDKIYIRFIYLVHISFNGPGRVLIILFVNPHFVSYGPDRKRRWKEYLRHVKIIFLVIHVSGCCENVKGIRFMFHRKSDVRIRNNVLTSRFRRTRSTSNILRVPTYISSYKIFIDRTSLPSPLLTPRMAFEQVFCI